MKEIRARTLSRDREPGRDDPRSRIPCSRFNAAPKHGQVGREHFGDVCSCLCWRIADACAWRRFIEHGASMGLGHLLDRNADVVEDAVDIGTPRTQLLGGLLENSESVVAVSRDGAAAEGFERPQAVVEFGVVVGVARLQSSNATLNRVHLRIRGSSFQIGDASRECVSDVTCATSRDWSLESMAVERSLMESVNRRLRRPSCSSKRRFNWDISSRISFMLGSMAPRDC